MFAFSQVYLIVIFIRTNNIFIICIMMYFTMFNTMIKIIYIKKRRGPRTEFRGSPCRMVALVESNITWFASLAYNIMSKIIISKIDDKMIWSTWVCSTDNFLSPVSFPYLQSFEHVTSCVSTASFQQRILLYIYIYFLGFFGGFLVKMFVFLSFPYLLLMKNRIAVTWY